MPIESALDGIHNYDSPTVAVSAEDLRDLLNERARLQEQVKSLQDDANKMLERHRSERIEDHVREFHVAFGLPVHDTPHVPSDERIRFRLRLIAEEFCELLDACFDQEAEGTSGEKWRALVDSLPLKVDLPELADALADLDYVVEGTRLELGIKRGPIAREVHRTNMAKLHKCRTCAHYPPGADHTLCSAPHPDGKWQWVQMQDQKVIKPEGWEPPDIVGELIDQGWRPE